MSTLNTYHPMPSLQDQRTMRLEKLRQQAEIKAMTDARNAVAAAENRAASASRAQQSIDGGNTAPHLQQQAAQLPQLRQAVAPAVQQFQTAATLSQRGVLPQEHQQQMRMGGAQIGLVKSEAQKNLGMADNARAEFPARIAIAQEQAGAQRHDSDQRLEGARVGAGAEMHKADRGLQGQMFMSQADYAGRRYVADRALDGQRVGAGAQVQVAQNDAAAKRYMADRGVDAARVEGDYGVRREIASASALSGAVPAMPQPAATRAPTAQHIVMLTSNPTEEMIAYFDEAYGPGSAAEVLSRLR